MRALTALILSTSLLASSMAVAADKAGPLAPGKPAGVHKADLGTGSTGIVLLGFDRAKVRGDRVSSANRRSCRCRGLTERRSR